MILSKQQRSTIKHLKRYKGITEPGALILWCNHKMTLPRHKTGKANKGVKRNNSKLHTRKYPFEYYKQIIDHYSI